MKINRKTLKKFGVEKCIVKELSTFSLFRNTLKVKDVGTEFNVESRNSDKVYNALFLK